MTPIATQPTTLIRRWVLERLDDELARRGDDEARRRQAARQRAAEEDEDVFVMTRSELQAIVRAVVIENIEEMGIPVDHEQGAVAATS